MLWVHWRTLLAWLRGTARNSPLLLVVLLVLMLAYLTLGYLMFHAGLRYLYQVPLFGSLLSQRILFLVFAFFFVMLVFSNAVIGYTMLFRSRETAWMLSLPIPHHGVYRWKFVEALAVSSWALIFLSAPLMLAFGQVRDVGAVFYLEVAGLYLPFVIIPALFGSWLVVFTVRFVAGRLGKWFLLGGAVAVVLALIIGLKPVPESELAMQQHTLIFDKLLSHTKLAINPYMPSAWLIRSTLAWSDRLPRQGAFYFLLLASNAAMGLVVGFELVGRCFYGSWAATFASRAAVFQRRSLARRNAHRRHSCLERIVGLARPLSPAAAALALKDIRLFWRDPTQWIQFMIFFGLLCIYVINLRNIALSFQNPFWEALIAHFNLAACGLTLSTLTTRFVFPQFSLEGRRIWILGLSPFGLQRLLLQKFALAAFVSVTITGVMIVASSIMLKLPASRVAFYLLAVVLMCMALCGLSVGLGAVFPNFKEENPSKIVSGFGGTLCLVLSFIYLILFLALSAVPAIIHVHPWPFVYAKTLGVGVAVLLSLAAFLIPMQLAWRRVKRLEI
jgi:ABC-2 type transport system permease protein